MKSLLFVLILFVSGQSMARECLKFEALFAGKVKVITPITADGCEAELAIAPQSYRINSLCPLLKSDVENDALKMDRETCEEYDGKMLTGILSFDPERDQYSIEKL